MTFSSAQDTNPVRDLQLHLDENLFQPQSNQCFYIVKFDNSCDLDYIFILFYDEYYRNTQLETSDSPAKIQLLCAAVHLCSHTKPNV